MDEEQATSTVEATEAAAGADERGGFGSLGSIILLLALTWAAGIASFPLNDNSFFTHLATGRIILDEGSVPTADPYTFTADGEPWVVQSWLASILYAAAEQIGGDVGLRMLVLAVFLAAMLVLWRLTRPAESAIVRLLILTASLFVVTDLWSERPYMIGVIGLGLIWMAMEGTVRAWLLVPLMWLWANTHGSFVLALVLAACIAAGSWLDRRLDSRHSLEDQQNAVAATHRRALAAVAVGLVAATVGPLGPRLLLFPLTALSKAEVFAEIVEWRSPAFRSLSERAFLVFVVATILLLSRMRSWRLTIPAVVFIAAALLAQRNVVLATIVLVAIAARSAPKLGALTSRTRPRVGGALAGVLTALFVLVSAAALLAPTTGLGGYPASALAWLGTEPAESTTPRVAAQAFTGNLLEVLDGPTGAVFVDDRVDMFPVEVFRDSLRLGRGEPGWEQVLDDYEITIVVWSRSQPTASLLAAHRRWRTVYTDTSWMVACRRSEACSSIR